jgi:hypothetical protein
VDGGVRCEPLSQVVNRLTLERRLTSRRLTRLPARRSLQNNVLFCRNQRPQCEAPPSHDSSSGTVCGALYLNGVGHRCDGSAGAGYADSFASTLQQNPPPGLSVGRHLNRTHLRIIGPAFRRVGGAISMSGGNFSRRQPMPVNVGMTSRPRPASRAEVLLARDDVLRHPAPTPTESAAVRSSAGYTHT